MCSSSVKKQKMSKTRTYEVTLTPLEPYFFGGEKSFFKAPESSDSQEYYVRSNMYPQQTALMGAMRYLLLEQNGLLPIHAHRDDAVELIGKESFNMAESRSQTFGTIKEMSPVFFKNSNGWFRETERGKGLTLIPQLKSEAAMAGRPASGGEAILLSGYKAKAGIERTWINANGVQIKEDDILQRAEQVGIQKNREEGDEEAFYKQVYIKLKMGFAFVFQMTLQENERYVLDAPKTGQRQIVFTDAVITMGGERSPFNMQVKEVKGLNYVNMLAVSDRSNAPKMVLLSDAIVSPEALDGCKFALAETVDFRQLRTTVKNTENYYRRSKDGKAVLTEVARSNKFKLLERGGVLYFHSSEDMEAFAEVLKRHPAYCIGYNHHQTL